MKKKGMVLLALKEDRVPAGAERLIRGAADGRDVLITADKAVMEKVLEAVEIAAGEFPAALMSRAPGLKWFHQWYAGADWLGRHPEVRELPFTLTNSRGIHGIQMREHLFGLLIAWYRKFPKAFDAQGRHEWLKFSHGDFGLLSGKTMLILGYGTIGRQIARVAEAFGMRVVGVKRSAAAEPGDTAGHGREGANFDQAKIIDYSRLNEFLPEADIVVDILPLTQETEGAVGEKEFALMKKSALFANIGRGKTVDEAALLTALRDGTIAGAVLDVTAAEPLPPESPLWDAPNIIITSHYSGFHPRYDEMAFEKFLENLERYVRGEALMNVVDKKRGY
jgi:phosphoglycerate dehydrogenase-like enzyme